MSEAREALYMALWDNYTPTEKNRFIGAFTRELAEHIRAHADDPKVKPHLLDGEWTGLRMAANLISPEVSK
ncbi:hypothetical protein [Streptomyces roseolus]|uniref:hypothetical protein n=1 Tax=Streptomyces roseolus TaxID=67358 RepID=UPI00366464FF